MDEAEYCDNLLLMHKGKILRQGTPSGLAQEYPFSLYKVSAQDQNPLYVPAQTGLPEKVLAMYTAGSNLHIASTIDAGDSRELLTIVRKKIPRAHTIDRIKPGIEDMFLYYLSEEARSTQSQEGTHRDV
jgi:ABC-type multidrug transport system ATPase subunit